MQRLCRLLCICLLSAPLAAQGGEVKIKVSVHLHGGWWWPFEPRYAPPVSPHHIGAAPAAPATDSCRFVAGVRHCPRGKSR